MDRVAVIADGHAESATLEAVLGAIDAAGIARVWCLGDFCSGGPEPLECFERTIDACEIVLAGNHELFVVHRAWKTVHAPWARAAHYAHEQLGAERVEQLRDLHSHVLRPAAELVHGALTNPSYDFVLGPRAAQRNLQLLNRPLLLYGHTHQAACWAPHKNGRWARQEAIVIGDEHPLPTPDARHPQRLLNPGAVCDPLGARWLELRLHKQAPTATWHQEHTRGHGDWPATETP
jgi:predicted phosphodiesterase